MMRLFVSPWSRRLWTLQEAALSRNLLIRFADVSFPLQPALRSHYSMALFDIPYQLADAPPMAFVNNLLSLQEADLSVRLGRTCAVLGYRDTTNLADEAVCMGSILDADTRAVVFNGDRPESRMLKFYERCSRVPRDLLFLDGPKLQDEGFRWAPVSLLGMDFTHTISLEAVLAERLRGPEGGLYVASNGFLVDAADQPLTPITYVVDHFRAVLQPDQGDDPAALSEIISMMSSLLSPVFPHKDFHNVVWKLSYRGDIPWSALQLGRSNLGLIMQATFVHPGEVKRAVLVSHLHHRFQEEGANGQGRFWSLDEERGGVGELVVSGRFVARMDYEIVPLKEWERIRERVVQEGTSIIRPKLNGKIDRWIVR
jgi:hypothetical protein